MQVEKIQAEPVQPPAEFVIRLTQQEANVLVDLTTVPGGVETENGRLVYAVRSYNRFVYDLYEAVTGREHPGSLSRPRK